MKISKQQAAANKAALVQAASRLFREQGLDGTGIAEICQAAGLTQGALYSHFPTKDALAAEALAHGQAASNRKMQADLAHGEEGMAAFLDYYLSTEQRDQPGQHCAMAASASEIGRQDATISARFTDCYLEMAQAFKPFLPPGRAQAVVAAMIGAVAVARATAKADPALSAQILADMRRWIDEQL